MRSWFPLVLCAAACSSSGTSTRGLHGRDSFAYRASPGCEDGCNLQQYAVAADGAQQLLSVSGAGFASVSSSAPEVATFAMSGNDVLATTGMAGDADLILADGAGSEIDRVTLHVADVALLQFDKGWSGAGPILLENVPIRFSPVTKRDAGSHILLGWNAVRFAASGTLTTTDAPPDSSGAPPSIIESQIVEGTAGTGDLTGANGAQSFDVPVTVVSLADLTMLVADAQGTFLGSGGATIDTPVVVNVSTPAGLVYGTTCAWSVSDPSVELVVTGSADQLDRAAASGVTFKMTKTGTFTATCSIGRLSVVVPLKRDN